MVRLIPDVRRPGVVDRNVIDAEPPDVPMHHHQVPAAAVPVPRIGERLLLAEDLALDGTPAKRRVRGRADRESVLWKLRPAAVHARAGGGIVAAVGTAEALVRFVALPHVRAP